MTNNTEKTVKQKWSAWNTWKRQRCINLVPYIMVWDHGFDEVVDRGLAVGWMAWAFSVTFWRK
jgi:ABC-type antimicrobial peptide transport system ATPase subunit